MHRRRYLAGLSTALGLVLVGCTGSGTEPSDPSEAYRNAFRTTLTDEGIRIRRFEVGEGGVVDLEYVPAEATEASVEESVRTAGRAYYDRVYGGWDVDRLDAAAFIDENLVATWRMESEWVRQHRDGDISRDELGEKIQSTIERHDE